MAKGIRSKAMRKNRSFLRKTVIEPVVRKNQEQIANDLMKKIEDKQQSNSSLLELQKKLNAGFTGVVRTVDPDSMESDDENESKTNKKGNNDNKPERITTASGRFVEVVPNKTKKVVKASRK